MSKKNESYNIICLSNQLWDFPNWTNKRHVMSRMAKRGHNVLFVDPPINFGFVLIRQILRGYWGIKRLLTSTHYDKNLKLKVYTPVNFIPFNSITSKLHAYRIKQLSKNLDPNKKTILWIYHVQISHIFNYTSIIPHDVLVYDCVDNYLGFPDNQSKFSTIVSKKDLKQQEIKLAQISDIVFATTPGLADRLRESNPNTHFTPNVGDYERFKDAKKLINNLPDDIKNIPSPRIGYIGAIDEYKFDIDLMKKVASDHPNYSFVVIGPLGLKDKEVTPESLGFGEYKNVYFLGSKPYDKKAYYLAGFDVDLIPYQLNDYTVGGCYPVKFHDSLAAGLPVVVTNMPVYKPFENVCYISKTYEEFSNNIALALKEDSDEKISQRQDVAKRNNWDSKVDNMLNLVSQIH